MAFGMRNITAVGLGAALAFAASAASALPSWSYHYRGTNSQSACMDTADAVVRTYGRFNDVTFVRDHETDSVIEIEFSYVNNASADVVAILICSNTQATIVAFGTPYESTVTVRDDLRELFISFE